MSATSVTGVSGPGTTARPSGGNKGSEGMNLAVHRLIGPRVVMCEATVLQEDGTAIVTHPWLPGTIDMYCVFLQGSVASATQPPVAGDEALSGFGITGDSGDVVCWQIVKKGIWGSPTIDLAKT